MTETQPRTTTDRPRILVPLQILEGESLPEGVPELLANAHVVLLGYHVLPDQTAPGQARMQFEERAMDRLDDFEEILLEAGATVDLRLVFTHESQKTLDRISDEEDCLAVLVPKATKPPEDVIVAVRGTVGSDRLARCVAGLFADSDVNVTLFHVATADESDEDAQTLLDAVADRIVDIGMDADAISTKAAPAGDASDAIAEVAGDYDAVVMGESDPSLITFVFGMRAEQIADQFLGPVLIVQRGSGADGDDSEGDAEEEGDEEETEAEEAAEEDAGGDNVDSEEGEEAQAAEVTEDGDEGAGETDEEHG